MTIMTVEQSAGDLYRLQVAEGCCCLSSTFPNSDVRSGQDRQLFPKKKGLDTS